MFYFVCRSFCVQLSVLPVNGRHLDFTISLEMCHIRDSCADNADHQNSDTFGEITLLRYNDLVYFFAWCVLKFDFLLFLVSGMAAILQFLLGYNCTD